VRILHVIPWLAQRYGGPAILVPQAAAALAERGHHVEIITSNADGRGVLDVPTGRLVDWGGAPTTFHRLSRPRSFITSWPLFSDLRQRISTFDVVHIHYLYRFHGLAAARIARSRGIPYVIQAHGSLDPWHRGHKRRAKDVYHALVENRSIRRAAVFLCSSAREQSHIRALRFGAPTWVIPIGVDSAELRTPGNPEFLQAAGITTEARIVTFIGRISAKKGVPLLVDSFQQVADSFPLAHLVVAGPDDEGIGKRLAAEIAQKDIARRVSFIGPVAGSDKRALLQRSDVFVLPSEDESFGIAVAEAMAVGCPVVVTPEVAIMDVVRSTKAGLVAPRESSAIAASLETILGDPGRAKAMGDAGRRAVDREFDWPVVAEQMERMYEAVVDAADLANDSPSAARPGMAAPGVAAYACPRCSAALRAADGSWQCAACEWTTPSDEAVPILLPDGTLAEHDDLDHHHALGHKEAQAAHFDRAAEERFETERPHGSPRLYRFLLDEKFRRAARPLGPHLTGVSALTVCGGSGMDAEYLSRAGAVVITSDLSRGAAMRARARAERYGLPVTSIVADVEHLPFAARSMDLVAVHDGLHHLDDPYLGLAEMARVARRWIVLTEPAKAAITGLAISLGLALEREEAGNRVARMDPIEVAAFLEARGFVVMQAERYAMYYPHHPGRVFSLLSWPPIYPAVRTGWRLANALLGRFGNKMVVVAERVESTEAA